MVHPGVFREGHRWRQFRQTPGLAGVVGGGQFGEDHAEGPAVADEVVGGENDLVPLG